MEKVESPLEVLSRAATMVQSSPASDSDAFESPSTGSSESEGETLPSAQPQHRPPAGKWRRERRACRPRLPDYTPKDAKMALRSQSFNERRLGAGSVKSRAPHSDGDLSEEDRPQPSAGSPPPYPGRYEVPIDMRLRGRTAPSSALPPYARPSVITNVSETPGSVSMCDPVIDEHFRRSLGDNYMKLFKKSPENHTCAPAKPPTKDRASSPIQFKPAEGTKPTKIVAIMADDANVSVDDHFAKALGDTWKQIQSSRLSKEKNIIPNRGVVDDHFSKALGETWHKIQSSKPNYPKESKKDQTKIISRSGVVI